MVLWSGIVGGDCLKGELAIWGVLRGGCVCGWRRELG